MFLLVLAYPGSPRQKGVERLCVCVVHFLLKLLVNFIIFKLIIVLKAFL